MTAIIILARIVAIAASGLLLWTISNSTIETTGAHGADAHAIYALAVGVFVTACIMGLAWSSKRYVLAMFLFTCLLSGEAYNLLKTAEREVSGRDTAQNAVLAASRARETLVSEVAKAENALEAAQDAVRTKSAEKACLKNCAQLLTDAVVSARVDLDQARDRLAGSETPQSVTGLADRSGIPAWVIDLLAAAFKSLAMNGTAAGLAAFGAHGAKHRRAIYAEATATVANPAELPKIIVSDEPAPMALTPANDATGQSDFGSVSEFEMAKVAALFRGDLDGPEGPGGGNVVPLKRWSREAVREDLTARLIRGEKLPSQRAMSEMYGKIPAATLSNWLGAWEAEADSIIKRTQIGRRKMVAAG